MLLTVLSEVAVVVHETRLLVLVPSVYPTINNNTDTKQVQKKSWPHTMSLKP